MDKNGINIVALLTLCIISVMCIVALSMGRLDDTVTRGELVIGTLLSLDVFFRHISNYFNK